jgi:hypothetical protein
LNRDWRKDPKTWEKLGKYDLFSIESRATTIIAREALGAVLAGDDVWSSRWGAAGRSAEPRVANNAWAIISKKIERFKILLA